MESKWIKLSEKRPQFYKEVLVCGYCDGVMGYDVAYLLEARKEWKSALSYYNYEEILYWMELPELPEIE